MVNIVALLSAVHWWQISLRSDCLADCSGILCVVGWLLWYFVCSWLIAVVFCVQLADCSGILFAAGWLLWYSVCSWLVALVYCVQLAGILCAAGWLLWYSVCSWLIALVFCVQLANCSGIMCAVANHVQLLCQVPPQPCAGRHLLGSDCAVGQPCQQAHPGAAHTPLCFSTHGQSVRVSCFCGCHGCISVV